MRILVTGGAGFVGSHLACGLAGGAGSHVTALDNLKRRGAELNLGKLKAHGVRFVHGDVRQSADLDEAAEGGLDLIIDAAAEPSVHAGTQGSPRYVLDTNLGGTLGLLELARRHRAGFVLLSTSRVYSIAALREIPLVARGNRFVVEGACAKGVSTEGVAEDFETSRPRSLYGATKLASELFVQEYAATYDLPAVIDRCGVIAGKGQLGKVDQGVFTLWVAHHMLGKPLRYTGFGGKGLQVRDLLHPEDLLALLRTQIAALPTLRGEVFNVGGGAAGAVSLAEWSALCAAATGKRLEVAADDRTAAVDIPYYVTDARRVRERFGWAPEHDPTAIAREIAAWLGGSPDVLHTVFGG